MSTKTPPYLTLDEAITRIEALIKKAGSGKIAFMRQSSVSSLLQHCQLRVIRAGTNSPYKFVSRGGTPGILATATPEKMTAEEAVDRMKSLKAEHGGGIPFLADSPNTKDMQLCDLWLDRVGATTPQKRVSRGGNDVIVVTLTVPDKD